MYVFDEITKQLLPINKCECVIVKHVPDSIILGYSSKVENVVNVLAVDSNGESHIFHGDKELLKDILVYSTKRGIYISTVNFPKEDLILETNIKGIGGFPYSFDRRYEAIENFKIFKGKQQILNKDREYVLSKYLKYTFGLEFETSMGYIPEDICFRDGLIPLRDGSISGLEYSTVILSGNDGLSLLRQQLKTLEKYTAFNKECSLHIHFGGFPLNTDLIFRAYRICNSLEEEIQKLVPSLTFYSEEYKKNGKNYCSKLIEYEDFDEMYYSLVGKPFYGSLTQPHPNDIKREAKWRIHTRYYFVNFINMLCYNINKTIEFRFLRPTYCFKKIELWLYIFNAILIYAENPSNPLNVSLQLIIKNVYPKSIAEYVLIGITKLRALTINQSENGDEIGDDIRFDDQIFPDDES